MFSAAEEVQQIYKLALLCRIAKALEPSMNCDPKILLSEGADFACLAPELQRIVELQLFCEISGGVSAAIGQVTRGTVNPTDPPAGGAGIFTNDTTEELLFWNGTQWKLKT